MQLVVNGCTVLLDDDDRVLVEKGNLHIRRGGRNRPEHQYVYVREGGNGFPEFSLARLILGLPPKDRKVLADHINRNTLDNRRANLRAVSPRENALNHIPYARRGK